MAIESEPPISIGKVIRSLLLASLIGAAFFLGATVLEGLQFADSGGTPNATDIAMFGLLLIFFATPVLALIVVPTGIASWWAFSRIGLWHWWFVIPVGFLIGYGASWIIPFIPDVILVSQLSSPIRKIASTAAGGVAGVLLWFGSRPPVRDLDNFTSE